MIVVGPNGCFTEIPGQQLVDAIMHVSVVHGIPCDLLCINGYSIYDHNAILLHTKRCKINFNQLSRIQFDETNCVVDMIRVGWMYAGLLGGKGGFGSLLRGGNAKAKKNDNVTSMRDLNGRRIGDVENATALQQWASSSEASAPPSNVERQLNESFRRVNQGLDPEVKMCKFGKNCKYRHKCPLAHPADDEGIHSEVKEPVAEIVDAEEDSTSLRSSILAGMKRKRQSKKAAALPDEKKPSSSSSSSTTALPTEETEERAPKKKK
jgi:hypothetical protein